MSTASGGAPPHAHPHARGTGPSRTQTDPPHPPQCRPPGAVEPRPVPDAPKRGGSDADAGEGVGT